LSIYLCALPAAAFGYKRSYCDCHIQKVSFLLTLITSSANFKL
jgi:hypothetical protein